MAGNNIKVIAKIPDMTVDACGAENHEIASIPLVTSVSVALTTSGEVIIIMRQHSCHGKHKIIHSCPQMEHYINKACDRYIKVGDGQHATTLDDFKVPCALGTLYPTCTYVLELKMN